jgi:HAD superfamily hydrolase (TIGR01456 family)
LKPSPIAFVFDIDGVLMQSKNPIKPHASLTLSKLKQLNIPFILLTNGGGQTESARIEFLNNSLSINTNDNSISEFDSGMDIDSVPNSLLNVNQLVQSHTPMKNLTSKFKRVLVIGGIDPLARDVALNYGFKEVIRPIDIVRSTPNVWPYTRYTNHELTQHSLSPEVSKINSDPIDAVLVFNDPRDMGTDLQIIIDVLNSQGGLIGTRRDLNSNIPSVPIIWSNMDLLWSTGYPIPRFGQGAFRLSVRELYKELNDGCELDDSVLGKPWPVSFAYAEWVLGEEWRRINGKKKQTNEIPELGVKPTEKLFEKVYMVGDNPQSDIKGGNDYGWETILVKTGVYKNGDFERNHNLAKPTLGIFDNVWDGVNTALKVNGIK